MAMDVEYEEYSSTSSSKHHGWKLEVSRRHRETQEMEALAFEGSQGVELTDEEAEESARLYDEAQVRAENRARPQRPQPCCTA